MVRNKHLWFEPLVSGPSRLAYTRRKQTGTEYYPQTGPASCLRTDVGVAAAVTLAEGAGGGGRQCRRLLDLSGTQIV